MPKASNAEDLARHLAEIAKRFASLAATLGQAARELQVSGTLPPESLPEVLAAARREFVDMRAGVLEAARALSVGAPAASEVDSLKKLEPVVHAVVAAIAAEEKRQAAAETRKRALAVLDRVLAVTHTDDPRSAPLTQCQAKAKELRQTVNDPKTLETVSPTSIIEGTTPFAALLTLIDGREEIDDERFAALEDTVKQAFGRQIAVAATRGKLVIKGAATAAPPAPARPAPAGPPAPAPSAPPPPTPSAPPAPKTLEEVFRAATPSTAAADPAPMAPEVVAAAPAPQAPAEDAGAAQAVGQAAQDEAAQWWVSAWARWTSWKGTLSFNDAVKQELQKYSYILSVPIQRSTDYEEGLLAYGYSILLEYVERQIPGLVAKTLNSLKTFAPGPGKSVGAHLYSYLVSEGRLAELYPEFVKTVLVAAVPEPGLWTQARILESTVETRVFTHPSARIGDAEHNSQRLTQDRQRFTDHRFQVSAPPLTARFFAVAGDLREARSIDVKLVDGRYDSDQAWLLTMPPAGRADLKSELLRLAPEGTSVPGLGRDYATLWIAVFNADPATEKKYELVLGLRKEAGTKSAATFRSARA
jgi:hypothetical protein